MDRDRTTGTIHTLIELARNFFEGEEATGYPGGLRPEGLDETDVGGAGPAILLCSRDDTLVRRLLGTLRGQPPLPGHRSHIRYEGLFNLLIIDAARPKQTSDYDSADVDLDMPEPAIRTSDPPAGAQDGSAGLGASFEADFEAQFEADEMWQSGDEWAHFGDDRRLVEEATCALFVVSGDVGWTDADAHIFTRLRGARRPLAVVLCRSQGQAVDDETAALIYGQTGVRPMHVRLPASAATKGDRSWDDGLGSLVEWMAARDRRLPICLAQELPRFRSRLAETEMRNATFLSTVLGAEPAPLIDVPLLLLVQQRVARRLAAMYDQPSPPLFSREGAGVVTLGLCTRYLAQQAMKLIPGVGWLLSALLSGLSTWLLGMALLRRYDRRPLPDLRLLAGNLRTLAVNLLGSWAYAVHRRLRRRPRDSSPRDSMPLDSMRQQITALAEIKGVDGTIPSNGGPFCSENHGPSAD